MRIPQLLREIESELALAKYQVAYFTDGIDTYQLLPQEYLLPSILQDKHFAFLWKGHICIKIKEDGHYVQSSEHRNSNIRMTQFEGKMIIHRADHITINLHHFTLRRINPGTVPLGTPQPAPITTLLIWWRQAWLTKFERKTLLDQLHVEQTLDVEWTETMTVRYKALRATVGSNDTRQTVKHCWKYQIGGYWVDEDGIQLSLADIQRFTKYYKITRKDEFDNLVKEFAKSV